LEERGARAIATDVCDEEAVIRLIETTVGAFGRLDAAFNNAGGGGRGKAPLAALGTEEFDSVLGVNLRGAFLSMKHEIPAMLESGGGAIVNTSSTAGLAGAAAGIAPYVTAKHGLQGLTKIAALDYGERGIRVNAVAPGPILTDLLAGLGEERQAMVAQGVPMRRLGRPEEVAAAAVWLCSDEAAFITGATLAIDGGKLAGVA
ncbi:MAG: SDR family oxidoreductase, partial [Actinomycetota bacterium]|nr:SDR family oxidoreductase [Actinomycetota bacterium]